MYDVVIIGSGPAGIYASYYCGFQKLKAVCLEALPFSGGQLINVYKDKYIYDIPGFDKITAGEFIAKLENQYAPFKEEVPTLYGQSVKEITKTDEGFTVKTDKDSFETKTIIVSTGAGQFKPRPIGIPQTDQFTNIHYVADVATYKDKEVVVFGGGDSAIDFALMIEKVAKSVALVHRRDEFRAHAHSVDLLKASSIRLLTPYNATGLTGTDSTAKTLTLTHTETNETVTLDADYFLVNYGFLPSKSGFEGLDIESDKDGMIVSTDTSTSVKGVFAVGNASVYDGKIKTIAVGLGEVPITITAIKRYLNPGKIIGTVYSSVAAGKK